MFFRNAGTIREIILNNVELGTFLYIDFWRGHNNLEYLCFQHNNANHRTNFVDPEIGENTQLIEIHGGNAKN